MIIILHSDEIQGVLHWTIITWMYENLTLRTLVFSQWFATGFFLERLILLSYVLKAINKAPIAPVFACFLFGFQDY